MTGVVVDASTALAWCFPDETSEYADGVWCPWRDERSWFRLCGDWKSQTRFSPGERKRRLNQPQIRRFTTLLASLSLIQDLRTVGEHVSNVLPLAREYNLSAYDAAYLELSIRHGAPLATLDDPVGVINE